MFSNRKMCAICDMERDQDPDTGDSRYVVKNGIKIICNKDIVGVQTQALSQSLNTIFAYSVEIDRMYYLEQKYLYIDGKTYEIKALTKGSKPNLCKLNVSKLDDEDIDGAIKEWLSK